jgi:hypothetical protein
MYFINLEGLFEFSDIKTEYYCVGTQQFADGKDLLQLRKLHVVIIENQQQKASTCWHSRFGGQECDQNNASQNISMLRDVANLSLIFCCYIVSRAPSMNGCRALTINTETFMLFWAQTHLRTYLFSPNLTDWKVLHSRPKCTGQNTTAMKTKPNEKTGNCILMTESEIWISFEHGISISFMFMKWCLVLSSCELHGTEIKHRKTLLTTCYY